MFFLDQGYCQVRSFFTKYQWQAVQSFHRPFHTFTIKSGMFEVNISIWERCKLGWQPNKAKYSDIHSKTMVRSSNVILTLGLIPTLNIKIFASIPFAKNALNIEVVIIKNVKSISNCQQNPKWEKTFYRLRPDLIYLLDFVTDQWSKKNHQSQIHRNFLAYWLTIIEQTWIKLGSYNVLATIIVTCNLCFLPLDLQIPFFLDTCINFSGRRLT